jgi:hypothetical protein
MHTVVQSKGLIKVFQMSYEMSSSDRNSRATNKRLLPATSEQGTPKEGYALTPFGAIGGHVTNKHLRPTKTERDTIDQLSSAISDGFSYCDTVEK